MSPTAALADNDPMPGPTGWHEALLRRQIDRLDGLADAALALAKDIQKRSGEMEPGQMVPPISLGHASAAFDRVSRALRLTLMLQARLANQLAALERGEIPGPPRPRLQASTVPAADRPEGERQLPEAADRLEEDHFGDLLDRPVGEVIAVICRVLDLNPDDFNLAEEDIETAARNHPGWRQSGALRDLRPPEAQPPPPDPPP